MGNLTDPCLTMVNAGQATLCKARNLARHICMNFSTRTLHASLSPRALAATLKFADDDFDLTFSQVELPTNLECH